MKNAFSQLIKLVVAYIARWEERGKSEALRFYDKFAISGTCNHLGKIECNNVTKHLFLVS